jgi:hypothetical protein
MQAPHNFLLRPCNQYKMNSKSKESIFFRHSSEHKGYFTKVVLVMATSICLRMSCLMNIGPTLFSENTFVNLLHVPFVFLSRSCFSYVYCDCPLFISYTHCLLSIFLGIQLFITYPIFTIGIHLFELC